MVVLVICFLDVSYFVISQLLFMNNQGQHYGKQEEPRNNHRHGMQKRWHAKKYKQLSMRRNSAGNKEVQSCDSLDGSRIVNLDHLQQFISELSVHTSKCGSSIALEGEKRAGLASILSCCCSKCGFSIPLNTSKKVLGPKRKMRWEVNLAAVWGQISTGGGFSRLRESMSVLGIPVIAPKNFSATERSIGLWWQEKLKEEMIAAGKEEKCLAEKRGDYHEGVSTITVVVDAGWCKCSHRHSYNAKSGVGIIVSQVTGKLLYLGVRNKDCTACKQGVSSDKHQCFKNWDQSSAEMEPDIILSGFKEAEHVHGLRYINFVGDGDSSVYPTLIQGVTGWGRYIKKMECANHACKCYRSSLEKLVQEKPKYKCSGGLPEKMRHHLTSAAQCAIKMRSQEADVAGAIKNLEKDLRNGPLHCFGIHTKCSADFCKTARQSEVSLLNSTVISCDEPANNTDGDLLTGTYEKCK